MPFKIVRNDITKMNTEAIVNTANDHAAVGAGCDNAIYQAAGYDELLRYREEKIGFVPEGEAFITPGFHLQAKYIIHAVSPYYMGGDRGEEDKLRSCYRKSLQLARENGIQSIAFPLIATGGFGYPKEEGIRIAVDEITSFLLNHEMMIYLVVFDPKSTALGGKIYPDLEAYIDQNYVEKKHAEEYGRTCFCSMSESSEKAMPQIPNEPLEKAMPQIPNEPLEKAMPKNPIEPLKRAMSQAFGMPRSRNGVPFEINDEEEADYCFSAQHENKLEERMRHTSDTFSQYLLYLIKDKQMDNAEVYKRAIVDKKTFSKIKNNVDYHPKKLTALCLCVGAKLNLDESRDLLARAGYALSPCDKTDIIFSYFIENEIYDMIELDIQLEEHGLPCIIM